MRDRDDPDDRPRYDDDRDAPRPRRSGSSMTVGLIIGAIVMVFLCVGGGGALLLIPAVTKVREAASRTKDANNLKQIGLGMHNEMDVNGVGLCGPYTRDKDGRILKGLSFRVGILPYMEQDNLYRSFDLTQPWDEGRNKAASDAVVVTYTTPVGGQVPTNQTPYRVFYGGGPMGALFSDDGKPMRMTDVQDGTANTIMIVHTADRVPWAQPKEFAYNPNGALPSIFQPELNGTNVLFADGSVRFVRTGTSDATIRAMITRAGGEVYDLD